MQNKTTLCKTNQCLSRDEVNPSTDFYLSCHLFEHRKHQCIFVYGNRSQLPQCPCLGIMFIPNKYIPSVQFYGLLVSDFGLFFSSEQRAEACVPCSPVSALMPSSVMLAFEKLPATPSRRHLLPCFKQGASEARDGAVQKHRVPPPTRGVCPPPLSPVISSSSLGLNKWPSLTQAVRDRCYVKRGNWTQRCYSFFN